MPVQDYAHCFGWDFGDTASEIHRFPHRLLSGNFDGSYSLSVVSRLYLDAELPRFIDSQPQNEFGPRLRSTKEGSPSPFRHL